MVCVHFYNNRLMNIGSRASPLNRAFNADPLRVLLQCEIDSWLKEECKVWHLFYVSGSIEYHGVSGPTLTVGSDRRAVKLSHLHIGGATHTRIKAIRVSDYGMHDTIWRRNLCDPIWSARLFSSCWRSHNKSDFGVGPSKNDIKSRT